jgi:hypothetical protein
LKPECWIAPFMLPKSFKAPKTLLGIETYLHEMDPP